MESALWPRQHQKEPPSHNILDRKLVGQYGDSSSLYAIHIFGTLVADLVQVCAIIDCFLLCSFSFFSFFFFSSHGKPRRSSRRSTISRRYPKWREVRYISQFLNPCYLPDMIKQFSKQSFIRRACRRKYCMAKLCYF